MCIRDRILSPNKIGIAPARPITLVTPSAVSYTHLDVYKRQLLTYSRCKRLTGYIAKKEMLSYPLLRTWMKRLYCLFLARENPKEGLKTILQAIDYVKRGISICIFPEGTRNTGEELSLLPFHAGSFKIAEKTGCPIIPVSMNNTISIFEKQFPRIRKTHVIIEYGKPIYPNELDKETKKRLSAHCQQICLLYTSRCV